MGAYTVDPNLARAKVRKRFLIIVPLVALLPGVYAASDIARGARDKLAVDLQVGLFFLAFIAIAVFSSYRDALKRLAAYQARMQTIVDRTTEETWQLNDLRRSLEESGRKLKNLSPSKAAYRKLRETHDDNLRKYSALETRLRSDLAEYQALADRHNALVTEYNALPKR